jgi:hypothetical protein
MEGGDGREVLVEESSTTVRKEMLVPSNDSWHKNKHKYSPLLRKTREEHFQ